MCLWQQFWSEEAGLVLSAEAVLLGTVGVIGASVGLSAVSESVNAELAELASAFRSLDQSFEIKGQKSCSGWVAGSEYHQPPVEESLKCLRAQIEEHEKQVLEAQERERKEVEHKELELRKRQEHEAKLKAAEEERRAAEKKKRAAEQKKRDEENKGGEKKAAPKKKK